MISSGTQGQRLGFTLIGTTSVPCHVLWHFCAVYSPLVDEAPTSHIPALCAWGRGHALCLIAHMDASPSTALDMQRFVDRVSRTLHVIVLQLLHCPGSSLLQAREMGRRCSVGRNADSFPEGWKLLSPSLLSAASPSPALSTPMFPFLLFPSVFLFTSLFPLTVYAPQ